MPARLSAALALATVLATACTLPGERRGALPERALAAPGALTSRTFQQVLKVRFGDRERQLLAAGELCGDVLVLVLLSPQGLELLRLRQDADGVETRRREGLPRGLTARAILADLQLAYWPRAALRDAWDEDWTLRDSPHGRDLSYRGQRLMRVRYTGPRWQAPVTLEHERLGYRLQVDTIEHRPTPDAGQHCAAAPEHGPGNER